MNRDRLSPDDHLQAATTEASHIPNMPDDQPIRPVASAGVVGAGTMGGGIAMNFANAGIPCLLVDVSQEALDRGFGLIRRSYEASAAKGRITPADVESRMALLTGSLRFEDLAQCDLLIEAVFEDMALKKDVCARLGRIARDGAIIATNTSTLDVDVLADATGRPADVVGMHFFSPANVMKLLEVVRGAKTAPDVLSSVLKLAKLIGKVPVVSGVCYGFIGNRMAEVYMRETEFLLLEGASPADIDRAVEAIGLAMGPCRMLDMAGVDVGAKTVIEWKKSGSGPNDPQYRAVVDELYRLGRHGQKTGTGYYRYEGRTPVPDPELDTITSAIADGFEIERRADIDAAEIVERLLYPLVNEGCKILEEGIAYRPGDIDVVWAYGYGFPKESGGPLYWAETVGLAHIVDRLRHYGAVRGNDHGYWTPSALLVGAAEDGNSLAQQLALTGASTAQL